MVQNRAFLYPAYLRYDGTKCYLSSPRKVITLNIIILEANDNLTVHSHLQETPFCFRSIFAYGSGPMKGRTDSTERRSVVLEIMKRESGTAATKRGARSERNEGQLCGLNSVTLYFTPINIKLCCFTTNTSSVGIPCYCRIVPRGLLNLSSMHNVLCRYVHSRFDPNG
jgi:hypothetical protein